MILNQSVFLGMGEAHDRHRDMRLDVDNMSYEVAEGSFPFLSYLLLLVDTKLLFLQELLALEERIGNVNTGLSEETISCRLKQNTYALVKTDKEDAEPCCICQVLVFLYYLRWIFLHPP